MSNSKVISKKSFVILLHVGLSLLLPLLITTIIFNNPRYFGNNITGFLMVLYILTCSITLLFSNIFYFFSFDILLIIAILFRILLIIFFIYIHNKHKKIGIISDVVYVLVSITFGIFMLTIMNY